MRVQHKNFSIDIDASSSFVRIYYKKDDGEILNYDDTYKEFPTEGNINMIFDLPNDIPITDGVWVLGATSLDESGNESDMAQITPVPFDFIPPNIPTNLLVY